MDDGIRGHQYRKLGIYFRTSSSSFGVKRSINQ